MTIYVLEDYTKGYVKYNNEKCRFDIGWKSEVDKYKNGKNVGSCSMMTNDYDLLEVIRKYLRKSRAVKGGINNMEDIKVRRIWKNKQRGDIHICLGRK